MQCMYLAESKPPKHNRLTSSEMIDRHLRKTGWHNSRNFKKDEDISPNGNGGVNDICPYGNA